MGGYGVAAAGWGGSCGWGGGVRCSCGEGAREAVGGEPGVWIGGGSTVGCAVGMGVVAGDGLGSWVGGGVAGGWVVGVPDGVAVESSSSSNGLVAGESWRMGLVEWNK